VNRTLLDYYRLPADSFAGTHIACERPTGDPGFFRFGPQDLCYGRCEGGVSPSVSDSAQFDASRRIHLDGTTIRVPFCFTEVIENLRLERYRRNMVPGWEVLAASEPVRKLYYFLRGCLPVKARRQLQKAYFRDWRSLPFPGWPVDFTVDNLHESYLRLLMESSGLHRVPFIWFWPDGAPSCLIMTHDVETAAGRDFTSQLMDVDDSFAIKSSFQVIPEKRYNVPDSYIEEIRARGFEFNIHDLNHDGHLYREREEFIRRAARINSYVRQYKTDGFRSGAMYRNQDWYDVFEVSYDMSVPNVAHLEPMRGGCCTVMPYFVGKIAELPLTAAQDYSLFHILNDYSITLWKQQIELLARRNGLISFITHPDYLIEQRARDVYKQLLDYLRLLISSAKIWAALPGEVNQWWRSRSQMKLVPRGDDWEIVGAGKERARLAYAVLDGGRLKYELAMVSSKVRPESTRCFAVGGRSFDFLPNGRTIRGFGSGNLTRQTRKESIVSPGSVTTIGQIGEELPVANPADCEAVIIGAGPYGLSAAAHLKAAGLDVRVFGRPMEFWADKMPAGMLLRSPRVASNISDPQHRCTLEAFECSAGIAPRKPLPLETFVEYGQWFQRQLVPDLDQREIASVRRDEKGFVVTLEGGGVFRTQRVIVAAGIGCFRKISPEFQALPPTLLSHSYEGRDLREFPGKRVAVIGAGQSALESAALLQEAGAEVELIAKIPTLRWIGQHPKLHKLGPLTTMMYSSHDVGPAGISRLVAYPNVVKHIPLGLRDKIRKRAVRAAGSQWLPARLRDVTKTTGRFVTASRQVGQTAELTLDDGTTRLVDHVLLGTGYSVDIALYKFLPPELVGQIELMEGYPRLRSGFRTTVPGLHFIGATAARSFGPLLYFVAGTEFASNELTSYVVRHRLAGWKTTNFCSAMRNSSPRPLPPAPRARRQKNVGALVVGGDHPGLAIARSLGRHGIPVYVIDDTHSISNYSRYATKVIRVPDLRDPRKTVESTLDVGARYDLQDWVLFPTRDETVMAFSLHRGELDGFYRVTTPEWECVREAWDKNNIYKLAERLGIPAPRTWTVRSAAELSAFHSRLPLAIKPAIKENFFYATGAKAWRAETPQQLQKHFEAAAHQITLEEILLQEIIPGDGDRQLSYCAFFREGAVHSSLIAKRLRQHPREFGRAATYVETVEQPEIEELSERFLRAINFYGLAELEYKQDPRDGKYKLLDVNARAWGFHGLGQAAGVDFPYLLFADQIGLQTIPCRAKPGVGWLRLLTDGPTSVREILGGHLPISAYLQSIRRTKTESVFSWEDPLPSVAEFLLLPYILRKKLFPAKP
jgi:predicted ATP-grasp superfamily ATP-dependent carboligase/cation diffusion facilitator CzcD-associated flavoprotein CzcO